MKQSNLNDKKKITGEKGGGLENNKKKGDKKNISVNIFLLLIILFFLSSLAFAQAQTALELKLPNWLPLLAIALALGYGIGAIVYFISSVFKVPELTVWAKTEIAEVTASAFIAAIVLLAAGFSDSIFVAATGNTPMQVSSDFLDGLKNKSLNLFSESVYVNWLVGSLSGLPPQYNINKPAGEEVGSKTQEPDETARRGPGFCFTILFISICAPSLQYYSFYGINPFLGHLGLLQSMTLAAIALSLAVKIALDVINVIALPVLVPFGIFLSIFSLTRKMGRTLIAMGICLYFFFPASIYLTQLMVEGVYKENTNPPQISSPSSLDAFKNLALEIFFVQMSEFLTRPVIQSPRVTGPPPYQATCPVEATVACAPSAAFPPAYLACIATYNFICFFVVKPFIVWPQLTSITDLIAQYMSVGSYLAAGWNYIPDAQKGLISASGANPIASQAGIFIALVHLNKAMAQQLTEVVFDYTPYVLQFAVPVILAPVIIFIIIITAIRSISPAIGGEIQILGLTELI